MSSAKLVGACAVAAVALSACGTSPKPVAGAPTAGSRHSGRGVVDDPRTKHLRCLTEHHLAASKVGKTRLQVGSAQGGPQVGSTQGGPSVTFAPTPGAAQNDQISGQVQAAEVIGSALLYPNQASDQELKIVETCLALGVSG